MKNLLIFYSVLLCLQYALSQTTFTSECPQEKQVESNCPPFEFSYCFNETWDYQCADEDLCCEDYEQCTKICKTAKEYNGCFGTDEDPYVDTCDKYKKCCYLENQCTHICKDPIYYKALCPEEVKFRRHDFTYFCGIDIDILPVLTFLTIPVRTKCEYEHQLCCPSSCLNFHVCTYPIYKRAVCGSAQQCVDSNPQACMSDADCVDNDQLCCLGPNGVDKCCKIPDYVDDGYYGQLIPLK